MGSEMCIRDRECKAFEEVINRTGESAVETMVESEKVRFPLMSWGLRCLGIGGWVTLMEKAGIQTQAG